MSVVPLSFGKYRHTIRPCRRCSNGFKGRFRRIKPTHLAYKAESYGKRIRRIMRRAAEIDRNRE